jgi:glutamate N-acetyltransferase / amino-acid N-acetyltransferase
MSSSGALVCNFSDYCRTTYGPIFFSHRLVLQFPGAPIIVGRSRLAEGGPLHALVINNKVSNVCSGGDGVADSETVCEAVAKALNLPGGSKTVLPSSTGVIGWRLPAKELANDIIPKAAANMQSESILAAAKAIMTTDRYPKVRSATLSNGARVVAIGKGAGMIEPNMATMLAYILTDATVPKDTLQAMLSEAVNKSFNSISVDGDESTSDTVAVVASNQYALDDEEEFRQALEKVCVGLASDIVRNGEGTAHVMRVEINNFPGTDLEARRLGRHIVNSPLFKCAVHGNDPNTGRLAAAIGSYMGKFKTGEAVDKMSLTLGGRTIFANGKFILEGNAVEQELSNHMKDAEYGDSTDFPPHQKFVEIGVDFGVGTASATVIGSDLSNEYIVVNADYRS